MTLGPPEESRIIFSTWRCLILFFFFLDFLMWIMFKVFTEFFTILLLFYVLVFWPRGIGDRCSPTRDWCSPIRDRICTPCIERWSLNHWTAREVPKILNHIFQVFLPSAITCVQILRTRRWTSLESHSSASHVWWDSNVTCCFFFATPTSTEKDNVLSFKRKMRSIHGSRERE